MSEQYWLKWNNHADLLGCLDSLFSSEAFVDVTLFAEGKILKAHKIILSACSPYFDTLFRNLPNTHPAVFMKDMKFSILNAIIDFVYKGQVLINPDEMDELLNAAEALKIKGLEDFVMNERTPINVVHIGVRKGANKGASAGTRKRKKGYQVLETVEVDPIETTDILQTSNEVSQASIAMEAECQESEEVLATCGDSDGPKTDEEIQQIPQTHGNDAGEQQDASGIEEEKELADNASDRVIEITSFKMEDVRQVVNVAPHTVPVTSGDPYRSTVVLGGSETTPSAGENIIRLHFPKRKVYTKFDMEQALEQVRLGRMGIKPAAEAYNIPVATLHHAARRHKIQSPMMRGGRNTHMKKIMNFENLNPSMFNEIPLQPEFAVPE